MSKLPIKNPDFANCKSAMESRLAAMRKQAGVSDTRVLQFTCSVHSKPFAVNCKRGSANQQYRIESIDARDGSPGGLLGKLFGGLAPDAQKYAVGEFDLTGFACPHCQHSGSNGVHRFFGCGCGKLMCGGSIQEWRGMKLATCALPCGHTGPLEGTLKSYSGADGAAGGGRKAITGPGGAKRLTGPTRK